MPQQNVPNSCYVSRIAAFFFSIQIQKLSCNSHRCFPRGRGALFFCLLIVAIVPVRLPAATYNNVPPGFEYLLEKQSTQVDVVFGGRIIGSFIADYQPGNIQFRDPAAIISKIPNLIKEDRAEITRELIHALSGELDTHTEKSCFPVKKPDCDMLKVNVAGVIFNQDTFQAILFVNPAYLEVKQNGANGDFFKAPQTGLTNVNQLGAAVSGSNEADTSYSLNARMLFGNNETHLIANALVTSEYALSTNEILLERDMPGYFYGGGLFRSSSPPLVSGPLLYGGVVATSYRTQVNRQQNLGNELLVFLPRPAQVEIWRDGRILSVSAYESGNQVLDTSTLPLGNYMVTLKIREVSGITAEETRFFIKSDATPQAGLPLINAEAGKIAQEKEGLPSAEGDFWVHGSLLNRMNENLALGGDALIVGETVAGSGKAQLFWNQWVGNAALTVTSKSNAGVALDLRKDFRSVMNISAGVIQTWINDRDDPVPLYNVNAGNSTQLTGQFSIAFPRRSRLSLAATYDKAEDTPKNYSLSAKYTIPVLRFGRSQLFITASATKASFDSVALVQFELIGNTRNSNWMLRGGYEEHSELESGPTMAGSYGLTKTDFMTGTGSITVGAEQLANEDRRLYTNGALTNPYGRLTAGAQVTHRVNRSGDSSSYYANFNTGIVATDEGVGLGGQTLYDSATLVHLDGAPDIARFDVYIDGQVRAKGVPVGSSVPLFVKPYEMHKVHIRGVNTPSVDFDATSRNVVLFPGNVEDMVWNIKSLHVVFGRLLDETGSPIRNAILKGMEGPVQTDDYGYFQGEVSGETEIRAIQSDGRMCRVNIGLEKLKGELVRLGNVLCKPDRGMFTPVKTPIKEKGGKTITYNNYYDAEISSLE